ncbi:SDR family oxidoreductase [Granulosicoccus antarcticus]|uniref:C-factor n=1 Tax=Granulosicoccus antarcticus IMCC3135 TaxID=1192854 RepID=A0A2Z2NVN9_9GAMM|nr:SDR family oxidoreductase [Granulosicoccus antarcticus]ASJ71224.1 C-factor [Granulosicoccus antarcticus IMCC3135]
MQTYLITGANRGIGLEMTRQALELGLRVIATCRDPSSAAELAALEGLLDIQALDVTDQSSVDALAATLTGVALDVLINNAGVMATHQSIDDMDYEEWMTSFAINAIAPWRVSVAFEQHLKSSSRPRVATLTSQMASLKRAGSDRVAYRSSKAAANMAMRTLALEWQAKGITVCSLHPGWVQTDMGGSNAALGVVESASGLLEVIDGLSLKDTGRFLDYEGERLPW